MDSVHRSFKQTIFMRRFAEAPEVAIRHIYIEIENKEVEFVVRVPHSPHDQTSKDESYTLAIPSDGSAIEITAKNIYGAYHALNSLLFLIQFNHESSSYIIKHAPIKIADEPFLHVVASSHHHL